MIALSRIGRRPGALLVAGLLAGACGSHNAVDCPTIGCYLGSGFEFLGDAPAGKSFQIEIDEVAPQTLTPMATCTFGPPDRSGRRLACTSSFAHEDVGIARVQFTAVEVTKVMVIVSLDGQEVGRHTLEADPTPPKVDSSGCSPCPDLPYFTVFLPKPAS